MTVVDQVKAAQNPQEALLAIAEALDALLERDVPSREIIQDAWGEWQPPQPMPPPSSQNPVNKPQLCAARIVEGGEEFPCQRHAGHSGPHSLYTEDQLEAIARNEAQAQEHLSRAAGGGTTTNEVLPPSEEKMDLRRMFARQQLRLDTVLAPEGDQDWIEVYAKGGPEWLYEQRRDIVMGLDFPARRLMVDDVEEYNPAKAYEMSLDMLKQPAGEPDFESGAGALATGTVSGRK